MKTGVELISEEREEQKNKHSRSIDKDVLFNSNNQLCDGAIMLLSLDNKPFPEGWDSSICKKMIDKSYKKRLIIAGALIAAEIDRLNNDRP